MSKYTRYDSVISKNCEEDENHWLKQFESKLIEKEAVQSKSVDSSLFDQITSIISKKSKYPSVSAAVEDMKERSGLSSFLKKMKKNSEEDNSSTKVAEKIASDEDNNDLIMKKIPVEKKLPVLLVKCPNIKSTFENIINSSRGNLPIPAIIERVKKIHSNDVSDAKDWENSDLLKFVSQLNLREKSKYLNQSNDSNLGKSEHIIEEDLDSDNNDAFNILMPNSS